MIIFTWQKPFITFENFIFGIKVNCVGLTFVLT
jgi:hypothetical protein